MKTWPIKKLEEYMNAERIELTRGNVISQQDMIESPGSYPVYSSSIQNGGMFGRYGHYMYNEELITWSVDGGGNFFYRPKHKFSVTNVAGILRLHDDNLILKFLYYLLIWEHSHLDFDYIKKAHPSVIKALYYIAYPSLSTQQKIVQILDSIHETVRVQEKIIEKTKELKKSLLNEIFNAKIKNQKSKWPFKLAKLGEFVKIERGKFGHRPRNDPDYYGGNIPFIQTGDVSLSNGHIKKYSQTLNQKGLSVSKIFPKGTIVITIAANIGYSAILDFNSAFPDSLIGITPDKELDSEFLNYYLTSQQKKMDEIAARGTQKNINIEFLKPWPVPMPSINKQCEIVNILQTIDQKIEIEQKKKALYEELFKTMLNNIMGQKIDVEKIKV